jgi:hypothetical protein
MGTILGTIPGQVFEGFLEATPSPEVFVFADLGGLDDVGAARGGRNAIDAVYFGPTETNPLLH